MTALKFPFPLALMIRIIKYGSQRIWLGIGEFNVKVGKCQVVIWQYP